MKDLAAIERRYGALACPLGVLLYIEGEVDRLGTLAVFDTQLVGLPIITGPNKERHLHLLLKVDAGV
jgi:hypothetical protein